MLVQSLGNIENGINGLIENCAWLFVGRQAILIEIGIFYKVIVSPFLLKFSVRMEQAGQSFLHGKRVWE